jgi:hypothetical protein
VDSADDVLVCWLRLLGWRVETGRDGDTFVAVACRHDDDRDLVAAALTATEAELPLAIFSAAFARLEQERAPLRAISVAA